MAVYANNEINDVTTVPLKIPMRYRRRYTRLRPVFPKLDWMICPNFLAYLMSWYGLLIGKFPVQVMCTIIGIAAVFCSGLMRIAIKDLKTNDFMSKDSEFQLEREKTVAFDWSLPENPTKIPEAIRSPTQVLTTRPSSHHGDFGEPAVPSPVETLSRKRRAALYGPDGVIQNCRQAPVLIVAKRNISDPTGKTYNLQDKQMLLEIEALEKIIYNITVEVRTTAGEVGYYSYDDNFLGPRHHNYGVCTKKTNGVCGGFTLKVMKELLDNQPLPRIFAFLTWPHYNTFDLSKFFGQVETVGGVANGFVKHIGAMREIYCINEYYHKRRYLMVKSKIWLKWEAAFHETLSKYQNDYFDIYWATQSQKKEQQSNLVSSMMPKLLVTFAALMLWCAVGALMGDAVQSKPWVGFIGILSTMTACAAGIGVMLWKSPVFKVHLMAVPLLTLAVGLDDMFILFEAWSSISPKLPVEERMMTAMNIGGTSIIITFCINLIDFIIGNYTPFSAVQMLSEYAIATMTIDFVFQMSIFAPCLVLFGRVEDKNRHACCCCLRVDTRTTGIRAGRNACSLICCSGGFAEADEGSDLVKKEAFSNDGNLQMDSLENKEHMKPATVFFVNVITSMPCRIISLFLLAGYLAASVWSISQLEVGLKAERLYNRGSNLYGYHQQHRLLFTGYGKEVLVVVNNEVNYADPEVQRKLFAVVDKIESDGYFWKGKETKFWLRDFNDWAWRNHVNFSDMKTNKDILEQMQRYPGGFLSSSNPATFESYNSHARDIRMTKDGRTIAKSRFHFRSRDMTTPSRQISMMQNIRTTVKLYQKDIEMYAFNHEFELYDSYLTAVPTTLYYCGITLAATFGVAIIMIPHPACMFWVACFVSSVLVGIIGLMRVWDIDLDSASLLNLLIAISFCSDLIAHPIYIFMVSPAVDENGRRLTGAKARICKAKAVVVEVGGAAIPAGVGTTLSVIAMSNSTAYIFVTFFRIMFLAVILSLLHAIIFVPSFLSFIGPSSSSIQISIRTGKETEGQKNDIDVQESDDDSVSSKKPKSDSVSPFVDSSNQGDGSGSSHICLTKEKSTGPRERRRVRRKLKSPSRDIIQIKDVSYQPGSYGSGLSKLRQYVRAGNGHQKEYFADGLPPGIGKVSSIVADSSQETSTNRPTSSNSNFAGIKEELERRSEQLKEFDRRDLTVSGQNSSGAYRTTRSNSNSKRQNVVKKSKNISSTPPITSYGTEQLRRWEPSAVPALHRISTSVPSRSSSRLAGSGKTNDALCTFDTSRTGLTMLPAKSRFNM